MYVRMYSYTPLTTSLLITLVNTVYRMTHSRTPLIRTLVIQIADYPGQLGPSGKYVENSTKLGNRGSTVVKVLCYKSQGRWFDSRWCRWIFPLTEFSRSHYGLGVDSASNRNEYQEYFLGVKAAGA
jgi:hypothetical protein